MNKEQFQIMLDSHDWYYEFSDDYRVWSSGNNRQRQLERYAEEDESLMLLYNAKIKSFGYDSPLNTI